MTDMRETERERIGRLANEICGCSTLVPHRRDIALIEAEIDRRVAEERAKLLERLREPGWGLVETVMDCGPIGCCNIYEYQAKNILISIADAIAQFEKENSHESQ